MFRNISKFILYQHHPNPLSQWQITGGCKRRHRHPHTHTCHENPFQNYIYIHTYILYINAKITSPILSSFIIEAMRIWPCCFRYSDPPAGTFRSIMTQLSTWLVSCILLHSLACFAWEAKHKSRQFCKWRPDPPEPEKDSMFSTNNSVTKAPQDPTVDPSWQLVKSWSQPPSSPQKPQLYITILINQKCRHYY